MEPKTYGFASVNEFRGFWEDIFSSLSPDISKIDKPKAISGSSDLIDSLKPCQSWIGNLDDTMLDRFKAIVADRINAIGVKADGEDSGALTVGAVEMLEGPLAAPVPDENYTAADIDSYLNSLGVSVPGETRSKLKRRPKTLNIIKSQFTAEQQAKLVGNPFLIGLLTMFGPHIVKWLIDMLSR